MSKEPPILYLDGCTMFPNTFGKVSHKDVCDQHDRDYWNDRTLLRKFAADWRWFVSLNRTHLKNNHPIWMTVVFPCSVFGLVGLSVFGLYFWRRRHEFDGK